MITSFLSNGGPLGAAFYSIAIFLFLYTTLATALPDPAGRSKISANPQVEVTRRLEKRANFRMNCPGELSQNPALYPRNTQLGWYHNSLTIYCRSIPQGPGGYCTASGVVGFRLSQRYPAISRLFIAAMGTQACRSCECIDEDHMPGTPDREEGDRATESDSDKSEDSLTWILNDLAHQQASSSGSSSTKGPRRSSRARKGNNRYTSYLGSTPQHHRPQAPPQCSGGSDCGKDTATCGPSCMCSWSGATVDPVTRAALTISSCIVPPVGKRDLGILENPTYCYCNGTYVSESCCYAGREGIVHEPEENRIPLQTLLNSAL